MKTIIFVGQLAKFANIFTACKVLENLELSLNTAEAKLDGCISQTVELLQRKSVIGT